MTPIAFRLYDLAGSIVWLLGPRAWVLWENQWVPLADLPVPCAGSVLNRNAMDALVQRVGTPC